MEDIKKAIDVLKYHQEWRKGAEIPQTDVKELTNALDTAIEILSKWEDSERWRKVEEELPEEDETLLIDSNKKTYKGKMEKLGLIRTKPILVKYQDNSVVISYRCQCKGDSYYWWECTESFEKDNPKYIISWKPIH